MDAGDEVDGVLHLQPARQDGHVGDEAHLVHQRVALGARIEAQHRQLAVEARQSQHGFQRCRLARTVRTDQADDAAGLDLEAGLVQRNLLAIALAQIAGADDGAHAAPPCRAPRSSCSISRPRRRMRYTMAGHSSRRKRSRSDAINFSWAPSVMYIPNPLRFSMSVSSTSS